MCGNFSSRKMVILATQWLFWPRSFWPQNGHFGCMSVIVATQRSLLAKQRSLLATQRSLWPHSGHYWPHRGHFGHMSVIVATQRSLLATQRSFWPHVSHCGHIMVIVATQRSLWPHSGHYWPHRGHFILCLDVLLNFQPCKIIKAKIIFFDNVSSTSVCCYL